MSYPDRVGEEAQSGAQQKSSGMCLRYVGNAVQRARGQNQTNIGINSAKDSAPFFTKRGFVQIGAPSSYQNGDIVIFKSCEGHPHGHIQVYNNGGWYSDFKQKNFYPYRDGSKPNYSVYRAS